MVAWRADGPAMHLRRGAERGPRARAGNQRFAPGQSELDTNATAGARAMCYLDIAFVVVPAGSIPGAADYVQAPAPAPAAEASPAAAPAPVAAPRRRRRPS